MRDYLVTQIEKRRADIKRLEAERQALAHQIETANHQIETINVELCTYADVLQQLEAKSDATPASIPAEEESVIKQVRFAKHWQTVIRAAVERYPHPITNGEVPEIIRVAGHDPVRQDAIRSHVWSGAGAGLYEKLGRGSFRATQKAADLIGSKLGGDDKPSRSGTETPNSGTLFGAPKSNGAMPLET